MVKTVKLDKRDNYLLDSSTGERLEQYDPSNKNTLLILKLDNSILNVDSSKIKKKFGNIFVQYNDDKYIIDDGYQNTLIRAGYIVYQNYDTENIFDKRLGTNIRNSLLCNSFNNMLHLIPVDWFSRALPYSDIKFNDGNFIYRINFNTVNNIVTKNQKRKENSLPYFPFDKNMDKYGTIYITVYAQKTKKLTQEEGNNKFILADDLIFKLIKRLGKEYKYLPMTITKRIMYWD